MCIREHNSQPFYNTPITLKVSEWEVKQIVFTFCLFYPLPPIYIGK